MKNTVKANLVQNTDSGLVTSVSGAVFVLAFWDSKSCFLTSILPKSYPLVRLLKQVLLHRRQQSLRAEAAVAGVHLRLAEVEVGCYVNCGCLGGVFCIGFGIGS